MSWCLLAVSRVGSRVTIQITSMSPPPPSREWSSSSLSDTARIWGGVCDSAGWGGGRGYIRGVDGWMGGWMRTVERGP
jgi:hypothetical protein